MRACQDNGFLQLLTPGERGQYIRPMPDLPVGSIVFWPSDNVAPSPGWRICNGGDEAPDSALGKLLGSRFGQSPDTRMPLLPDLRGRFARGAKRTEEPGASQASSYQRHEHSYNTFPRGCDPTQIVADVGGRYSVAADRSTEETWVTDGDKARQVTDHESRPVNIYLHFLIFTGASRG